MTGSIILKTLAALVAAMLVGDVALTSSVHVSRGAARTSVHRSGTADRTLNANSSLNRDVDIDRHGDRNIDVDRDIDVDVDHHYGGWGYGCCYQPIARAADATAAAVTAAAVVGSVVHSLPSSCEAVSINGLTYQRCGSTWYEPQFLGSTISYIVVDAPR